MQPRNTQCTQFFNGSEIYCIMIFYYPWTDKLVVMGNHRDAWVFGAVDPSSGTAVMMEIARGLGQLKKQGGWEREWRVLSAGVC